MQKYGVTDLSLRTSHSRSPRATRRASHCGPLRLRPIRLLPLQLEGYQDTLLSMAYTQFYKECQIFGTVDFIFGGARAVFQDCDIFIRKPLPGTG
ncbi:putative pectinesterase [Helianthus annuus]|nr:putative pectinesterase [Helianthus annuus]